MSENKSVNRVFLATVLIYIGASVGISLLSAYVPFLAGMSNYVLILLSQALVLLEWGKKEYCCHQNEMK